MLGYVGRVRVRVRVRARIRGLNCFFCSEVFTVCSVHGAGFLRIVQMPADSSAESLLDVLVMPPTPTGSELCMPQGHSKHQRCSKAGRHDYDTQ
jgi:hypothetical protein